MLGVDRLGEHSGLVEVGRRGLAPEHVGERRVREPARDRRLDPARGPSKKPRRALARHERSVAVVDVAREQGRASASVRATSTVGTPSDVRRQTRRRERADELVGRARAPCPRDDRTSSRSRADPRSGRRRRPPRSSPSSSRTRSARRRSPASASATIGAIQYVPVSPSAHAIWSARCSALLIRRTTAGTLFAGIEGLIRIRLPGEVRVRCDLPAREVDRLQAGLHHLDGLAAGERAEGGNELLRRHEAPQPLGAEPRERVLDRDRAPQPDHVLGRVHPIDAAPPRARPQCVERLSASRLIRSSCVRSIILGSSFARDGGIRKTPRTAGGRGGRVGAGEPARTRLGTRYVRERAGSERY